MAEHRIDGISELMEKSGLSRNAINRLYKGTEEEMKSTNLKTLITLCEVFECKLSDYSVTLIALIFVPETGHLIEYVMNCVFSDAVFLLWNDYLL